MLFLVRGTYWKTGQPFEPFLVSAYDESAAFQQVNRTDLAIDSVTPCPEQDATLHTNSPPPAFALLPPAVIEEQYENKREEENRSRKTLTQIGAGMVSAALLLLFFGRHIRALFFPDALGQGLTENALLILIPIWTIGIVGLILLIVGLFVKTKV